MSDESDIQHDRQCVSSIHVQWVFVAKYRHRVFDARAIDVQRRIFADVCSDAQTARVEMDGEDERAPARRVSSQAGPYGRAPLSIVR